MILTLKTYPVEFPKALIMHLKYVQYVDLVFSLSTFIILVFLISQVKSSIHPLLLMKKKCSFKRFKAINDRIYELIF